MNSIWISLHRLPVYVILVFFLLLLCYQVAIAEWAIDPRVNTAICRAPQQQSAIQIVSDGSGGAIITWEDARNIHFDIYAQRVDVKGNVLWIKDGVSVCGAQEDQNQPRIIDDRNGGAFITWHDVRKGAGNYDIYAQHIDHEGIVQWAANGIPVCTAVNAQNNPCIVSDGAGGAIIIWQDFRTNYADLYAQRINKNGKILWQHDGVPVCIGPGAQGAPVAISDGTGGAIITWQDFRRSYADIYAQRIDGSGNILWEETGIIICSAPGHESFPVIIENGAEGAIVAWIDTRNSNNDIFAQQVDGNGHVQWLPNGIPVCTAKNNQIYPKIATDGAGGAIITWWDKRNGNYDIYAQHIDLAGNILWEDDGLAVCIEPAIQNYVEIASDGAGGAILVWNDNRASTFDIYAQRIDSNGNSMWKQNGLAISTAINTQCYPVLLSNETGGAIFVWQDDREKETTYWDIYAQKIRGNGTFSKE